MSRDREDFTVASIKCVKGMGGDVVICICPLGCGVKKERLVELEAGFFLNF
jgi:hypothetical protein